MSNEIGDNRTSDYHDTNENNQPMYRAFIDRRVDFVTPQHQAVEKKKIL